MTTLLRSGLLAGLLAGVIWGQDALLFNAPPAGPSGALKRTGKCRTVDRGLMVCGPGNLTTYRPLRDGRTLVLGQARPKVCSVRLLEALPSDAEFTMPQLRPDEHTEPMPLAKLPAPPCPKSLY